MTFLALDIGNTRLKWASYETAEPGAKVLAQGAEFLENIDKLAEGPWAEIPVPTRMLGCVVAGDGIRMRVQEQFEQMPRWDISPTWVVASESEAGLTNGYDFPARLGADRWVAMIGAWHRMLAQARAHTRAPAKKRPAAVGKKPLESVKRPLVVVMVGTAVTVEAIDTRGKFLGGFILPGHGIMLKALESGTAGLHVPTGDVVNFPTNTSDALTSGGTFAIAGAIERMVQHVRRHCGAEPLCYMTGGAGWKMAPAMNVKFELVDNLIFDGLLEIAASRARVS
jgi:type III pantothenate kinase